jgi:Raf kinase inhibitor-like YbhB/YbcL family protein
MSGIARCDKHHETDNLPQKGETAMKWFVVRSKAFENNQAIPRKYTEDGQDISPPLSWSGLPEGTKELAMIMDDPDAPRPQPWVHWVMYKIPANATEFPEHMAIVKRLESPNGALQGKNTWEKIGYGGPAPPKGHGVHHYHFKIYALDMPLNLDPGATKETLLQAMEGHIIAQGELIGTYQR